MPIIIESKTDGFRRCGVAHPKKRKEYPDGFFTPEQMAVLQAEPMLTITISKDAATEQEPEDHATKGKGKKGK